MLGLDINRTTIYKWSVPVGRLKNYYKGFVLSSGGYRKLLIHSL